MICGSASIISIHSLRMEGDTAELERLRYICISIHSLRMEGDILEVPESMFLENFNPLPPHGGRPTVLKKCPV